jgi:hypothetical protein
MKAREKRVADSRNRTGVILVRISEKQAILGQMLQPSGKLVSEAGEIVGPHLVYGNHEKQPDPLRPGQARGVGAPSGAQEQHRYQFQISDSSDCGLQIADCRLRIVLIDRSEYQLSIPEIRIPQSEICNRVNRSAQERSCH